MARRKGLSRKGSKLVLGRAALFFLPVFIFCFLPDVWAFRISRSYPLPPGYRNLSYNWSTVAYGGGIYLVYYDASYWDTLGRRWKQVSASRITPLGQVLDSLPVFVSLQQQWERQPASL